MATPHKKGTMLLSCEECYAVKEEKFSWRNDGYYSKYDLSDPVNYNITDHSIVYFNSSFIAIHLKTAIKGAVLKVKIGNNTYSKVIDVDKKNARIVVPIGANPYGSRITIKQVYKGRVLGSDDCSELSDLDLVYYSKSIRLGMTQSQVEYTYDWGSPRSTGTSSGGWTFWYYSSGSSIAFLNGKVYSWYKA